MNEVSNYFNNYKIRFQLICEKYRVYKFKFKDMNAEMLITVPVISKLILAGT